MIGHQTVAGAHDARIAASASFLHPGGRKMQLRSEVCDVLVSRTARRYGPWRSWAEADEFGVAERSTVESNVYVQPEEAAERGVVRCRGT